MDNEQTVEFLGEPTQPTADPVPPDPATPAAAAPQPPPHGEWLPPPPAGGRRGRWRFVPRSLAARLVAGVLAIVVFVVLATGLGTYLALRSFLFDRLDQQVSAAADQNVTFIERCVEQTSVTGVPGCPASEGPPSAQREWIAVLRPDGGVYVKVRGPNVSTLTLGATDRSMFAHGDSAMHTVYDGEQLRTTARTASRGFIVVTGLSTDEVTRTLRHLVMLETVIGATAVIVALLASAGGVQFSLRRLKRVTATAREVAAELSPSGAGLERRVPVDDDDTTEVGQLAESMNTLLAAVGTQFAARLESEQRMRQFMADASHELRTPLTSIRGYAELARMQRGLGTAAAGGEAADNLERIESEGTRMSRLVEDLLTLARGDQGGLPDLARVDVSELLDDVVTSSRAAFPHRQINARDVAGLNILGDHDQLLRAVRNLVSNAATHTRADGQIEVRAFASGPGVAIQVVDQGPGLPPDAAAHVFERFWRADKARTRARGGTGLGLAIVASIVQMHGGTVQFHSTVQEGSTVTIWLPTATG